MNKLYESQSTLAVISIAVNQKNASVKSIAIAFSLKNKLRVCKKRSVTMPSDSLVYLIVMETRNNEKVDFVVLIGSLWSYQLTSDNFKNLYKLCLEGNVLV